MLFAGSRSLIAAVLFAVIAGPALADNCAALPEQGEPRVKGLTLVDKDAPLGMVAVCHRGYEAAVDLAAKVPRWVAYTLTGAHSLGCVERGNQFHTDPALPDDSAAPSDYAKSGYDKGHMAPAQDFAWDADVMRDSFSMANMAPQKPGLNRQEWERLEETVRAWALERGPLSIYVGPILASDAPKPIGKHQIAVPDAFWKVVIDKDDNAIAFEMENKTIPKGDLKPFLVAIPDIERDADISLPVKSSGATLWPADLAGWRSAHRKACK